MRKQGFAFSFLTPERKLNSTPTRKQNTDAKQLPAKGRGVLKQKIQYMTANFFQQTPAKRHNN